MILFEQFVLENDGLEMIKKYRAIILLLQLVMVELVLVFTWGISPGSQDNCDRS